MADDSASVAHPDLPLGLPPFLSRDAATTLEASISGLWLTTMGQPLGSLEDDLEALRKWFDPVAQGSRLRRDLSTLSPPPAGHWLDPGPPYTMPVSADKRLVTPEGRCAWELLADPNPSIDSELMVADAATQRLERLLLMTYRQWNRHRLSSVVALLEGDDKPLQIAAAGVVVALLVNRCTSPERAMSRHTAGAARDVVDKAFFAAVDAFATQLAPRRRGKPENAKLISGWMLYEAGRRLGDGLILNEAGGGVEGAVWIDPAAIDHVLSVVARDLSRGHRDRVRRHSLELAFDALVEALRRELSGLAAFALAHERPLETARLRDRFLTAFERAQTS